MKELTFENADLRKCAGELYGMIMNPSEQFLFLSQERCNSLQEFEIWFQERARHFYHDFFLICSDDHSLILGIVYSYDMKMNNGHCKIAIYIKPEFRSEGIGAIAALKMIDYLFRAYPLRKIYSEVYDYNRESLASNLDAGFSEEACLKEYRYFNGEYYDLHFLSITGEAFRLKWKAWMERMNLHG